MDMYLQVSFCACRFSALAPTAFYPALLGNRGSNSTRSRDLARWQMADKQQSEEVQRATKRRTALVIGGGAPTSHLQTLALAISRRRNCYAGGKIVSRKMCHRRRSTCKK